MTKGGPEWFHPKRYGFGAGLPCAWQGWLVLVGFLTAISLAATLLAERNPIAFFAIVTPLTLMFILIVLRTTKGGAQWRWGKDEKKK